MLVRITPLVEVSSACLSLCASILRDSDSSYGSSALPQRFQGPRGFHLLDAQKRSNCLATHSLAQDRNAKEG